MELNSVHLVGRVGQDPEIKYFESGHAVANLSIAVKSASRNTDQPDWFNLEAWDKTAEIIANYVRQGSMIGIQGVLKFDHWQDRETGEARRKPLIRVDSLSLLASRRSSDSSDSEDF